MVWGPNVENNYSKWKNSIKNIEMYTQHFNYCFVEYLSKQNKDFFNFSNVGLIKYATLKNESNFKTHVKFVLVSESVYSETQIDWNKMFEDEKVGINIKWS